MNEKLKNLNKKQFEKCLISLEMLTFETPKIYTVFTALQFAVFDGLLLKLGVLAIKDRKYSSEKSKF